MTSTLVLSHRSGHHARASGYAAFLRHVDHVDIEDGVTISVAYRARRALSRWARTGANYDSNSVSKELVGARRMIASRPGVVHYLDAQRDAFALPHLAPRLGWSTVGTFHYPPGHALNVTKRSTLARLDAAIALASNQVDELASMVGSDNVHLIHHGVDTDYFRPTDPVEARPSTRPPRVLLVGVHLRDFETFRASVASLRVAMPDIEVHAVLPAPHAPKVITIPGVTVRSGVSDDELRDEYRQADVLLLPLTDAAACCALVEALACGLPIVSTDVGGVADYVRPGCGTLCPPGDAEAHAAAVLALLEAATGERLLTRAACRERALELALPVVAGQMCDLYRTLLGRHPRARR